MQLPEAAETASAMACPAGAGRVFTRLADLPASALLDEQSLADAVGTSRRTVQRMVIRGEIPPGLPLGGRPVWLAGRVCAWLTKRAEEAERQAAGQTARFQRMRA